MSTLLDLRLKCRQLMRPAQSNLYAYESLYGSLATIVRLGPNELLRGFFASSLRDAPYAGLFVVCYEGIKRETSQYPESSPPTQKFSQCR